MTFRLSLLYLLPYGSQYHARATHVDVSYVLTGVLLTSYLLPHTSYLLPHTSYLLPHTSYLLPHTSYLLPLTSFSEAKPKPLALFELAVHPKYQFGSNIQDLPLRLNAKAAVHGCTGEKH